MSDQRESVADKKESFEERAAIIEYCSERAIPRREAERIAARQMGLSEDEVEFLMGSKSDAKG
jgi:hypothetical protein